MQKVIVEFHCFFKTSKICGLAANVFQIKCYFIVVCVCACFICIELRFRSIKSYVIPKHHESF